MFIGCPHCQLSAAGQHEASCPMNPLNQRNIPNMEYAILTSTDPDELSIKVNLWLANGWESLGGVSVSLAQAEDYRYTIFAQAMIKQVKVVTRERMEPNFAKELRNAMAFIAIP